MPDPLHHFVLAQARNYTEAEHEIRQGRKTTHWMWYIFPQLQGLGRSNFALRYGLHDLDQATAYLAHPVLGPRLLHMARLMLSHAGSPATDIIGPIDAMKLRSCATLFAQVPHAPPEFQSLLTTFYDGAPCPKTLTLLNAKRAR